MSQDIPPTDHGSDRYDYVEVSAPEGITPSGPWFDRLLQDGCGDCRANIFLKYLETEGDPAEATSWHVIFAHDDSCPALARMEGKA